MKLVEATTLVWLLLQLQPVQTTNTLPVNHRGSAPNGRNQRPGVTEVSSTTTTHASSTSSTLGSTSSTTSIYTGATFSTTTSNTRSTSTTIPYTTKQPDEPMCGKDHECNPAGNRPCCHLSSVYSGKCQRSNYLTCNCKDCIDYRIVHDLRASGTNCTITRVGDFLKTVCSDEDDKTNYYFKCINSNVSYQYNGVRAEPGGFRLYSNACENDKYAYQSCNRRSYIVKNYKTGHALCGTYYCTDSWNNTKFFNCYNKNCPVSKVCPKDLSTFMLRTCDHKCATRACKDETNCNGYQYSFVCVRHGYPWSLSLDDLCNGDRRCDNGEDERDCKVTNTTLHTCPHGPTRRLVPIFNYTRCATFDTKGTKGHFPYCRNFYEQTNCSDVGRIGGRCLINGYLSSVSIYVVCDSEFKGTTISTKLCDNGLDDACITPSSDMKSGCKVHKHRMCDGVFDCLTGSDELDDMCALTVNNFYCNRTFNFDHSGKNKGFPMMWILDNVTDCENGEDEIRGKWKLCENVIEMTQFVVSSNEECQNVFRCSGQKTAVRFDVLCDGFESCGFRGNENKLCEIARDFPKIARNIPDSAQHTSTLDLCADQKYLNCKMMWFEGPQGGRKIFGISKTRQKLIAPSSKLNCSYQFGEYYVYLSCLNLCLGHTTCPLANKNLTHDSCPGQPYSDRVYTLAEESLTFAVRTGPNQYRQPNVFECNNRRCVNYSQVCDLINDCGDLSDEKNCTNHMICKSTDKEGSRKQLIALSQRCDGIYDCFDLSDECNDHCGKRILQNWVLRILCWLMGTLASGFNFFTVVNEVRQFRGCKTNNMLVTKALVSLIGCGDFLIGVYLVGISIYDSFLFGHDFCAQQIKWFTGSGCAVLGIISTVGSQLSLFTMTILSIDRMTGIVRNSTRMTPPAPVNRKGILKAVYLTCGATVVSSAIALIPLAPFLQDYFVQGMHYDTDPNYKLFIGFPDKARHIRALQAYHNTTNITADTSWREIGQKVDEMYSQTYGTMNRTAVHFYGNDGICLFKYFVRRDDPRRSRETLQDFTDIIDHKGDAMMWLILIMNLSCFIVITVCYVIINILTRRSSERSGATQNESVIKQNMAIQKKITAIIATDFVCWVPFSIICALHNLKGIDATGWYVNFSMVVLPINSVINPLLYDNTVRDFLMQKFKGMITKMSNSRIAVYIRQKQQERKRNSKEENIEMDIVPTPATRSPQNLSKPAENIENSTTPTS